MTDLTAGPHWRVARSPKVFGAGTKGLESDAHFMDEDVASCNAWMQHLVVGRAEIHAGKTPRAQVFGFSRDWRGRRGNRITFGRGGTL